MTPIGIKMTLDGQREVSQGLRQVGNDVNNLGSSSGKLAPLGQGMHQMSDAATGMSSSMTLAARGIQTLLGLQIVSWAKDGAAALYEASAAAERLRIGLNFASARGSADEIAYLRKTTYDLGLQFKSTAQSYMQFQAAAKGTSLEGEKARSVFESIAKASAVMGLSAEQNSGVLLALQQMVSKGTVQAEELRGQLGERLPGAFQIAARSMGVTTAELSKMLEMGQVISDDFLPKFAAELEKSLGDAPEQAANRLDASVNRVNDSWDRLKQNVGDSGVSAFWAGQLNILTDGLGNFNNKVEAARLAGDGFFGQLAAGAGAALAFANPVNAIGYSALEAGQKLKDAEKNLQQLKDSGAQSSSNLMLRESYSHAERLVNKLREAKVAQDSLAGISTPIAGGDPYNDGAQYGAYLDKQKKFDAAQAGLLEISARSSGINKQFTADLEAYANALSTGAMSAADYAKAVTDLNTKRYESTEAGKAEAKALRDSEKGAKGAQSTYESLAKSIQEKLAAQRQELQFGTRLTDVQKLGVKVEQELVGSRKASLLALVDVATAQQQELDRRMAFVQFAEDEKKARLDLAAAAEKSAVGYAASNKRLREETELIGLSEEAQHAINRARLAAQITVQDQHLAEIARANDVFGFMSREQIALEEQNRLLRERLGLLDDKKVREANAKAQDRLEKDWDRTAQTIGDTLADYIMSGGKDAATYLKRLFSTLVLQPVVQTVVGGIMGAGVAGASGVAAGGSSAAGGLLNMASNAYSALTSPMLTNFGVGLAGNIQQLGGTLFSKGFEAFGTSVVDFGNNIAGFSNAINIAGDVFGYGSAIYNLSQGKFGSAAGAAIGTYFGGPIGAMIGSTLGGLLDGVFGSSRPESARLGGAYSTAGLNDKQVSSALGLNKDFKKAVERRSNASLDTAVQSLVMSITGAYNSLDKYTGGKKLGATAAFADEPNLDDRYSWAAFQLFDELSGNVLANWNSGKALDPDGEKAFAVLSGKMSAAMVAELKSADIPGWMRQVLDSLGSAITLDGLSGAMQQIALIDAAFEGWADSVVGFERLSGVVQTTLLNASGGLEALATNVSGYYQNFYSEQERAAVTTRQLTQVLAEYGVALPSSKEDFRELIEQQLAAGEAGAELAAVLLSMQGIFASVATTWATELDGMAKEVADFFGAVHESIAGVTADVQATRQSILRGNGAMTAAEIQAAITAAMVQAPSTADSIAAQGGVATAAGAVAMQQAQSNTAAAKVTSTQELLSKAKAERDAYASRMNAVRNSLAVNQGQLDSYIDGKRSHYGSRRINIGYYSGQVQKDQASLDAMQPRLDAYNAAVAAQQTALDAATASAKANADALAAAKVALDAAQKAQADALTAYASEVAKYVGDASTSVGKLSELRGEVESFYEAQAQAVQAMLQSAGNIRNVADQVRLSQLTSAQTAQELGARYAMDYSMALATTGSTRAGYVDSMAGNLQSLSNAMKAEASSSAEWQISVGKLLAQASNAASLLDGDAKNDDYQDVALGLLDSIDTALEGLSTATKSAEQVIADAIAAGTQAQLEGLRAIVATLKGEPIPGFASGGMHLGGLRIVGENGPELEATGPSRIWNAQQMANALGGGMDSAAGMKAVLHEVQISRNEDRAHLLAILDVLEPFLRLAQRWDVQGFPGTRPGEEVTA